MRINALLASLLATSVSAQTDQALDELAAQLQAARSSQSVAITPCQPSMDSFIGLPEAAVVSKLGAPDLDEPGTAAEGQEIAVHQYLFAPPGVAWVGVKVSTGGWTAVWPMGKRFTVVQFHYDAAGTLVSARCSDRA